MAINSGGYVGSGPIGRTIGSGPIGRTIGSGPIASMAAGAPSSRILERSSAIEEQEEGNFVYQMNSLRKQKIISTPSPSGFADGGKYDAYLQAGKSNDLLHLFFKIFQNNRPPPNADMYGQDYPTQVFSPGAIAKHVRAANDLWDPSPAGNIQKVSVTPNTRLVVIGDTHGQLEDVLWIFYKYGLPSPTNRYLFNGDFVDRSCHGLEILLLLLAFRRDQPDSLYMLRGNHEDPVINQSTNQHSFIGYDQECITKSGGDVRLHQLFASVIFPSMPIMAHITSSTNPTAPGVCVVHGGLPPQMPLTLAQVGQINRCYQQVTGSSPELDSKILFNLLWSDPREEAPENARGRGGPFLPADAAAFCKTNNLRKIIRSHECKMEGYEEAPGFGGQVVTLFSSSHYCGHTKNKGAIMTVDADLNLKTSQFWAPDFNNLAVFYNHTKLGENQQFQEFQAADFEKQVAGLESPNPSLADVGSQPATPSTAPAAVADVAALEEEQKMKDKEAMYRFVQSMIDNIVVHKAALFREFTKLDADESGTIPKERWAQVIFSILQSDDAAVSQEDLKDFLFQHWQLQEPVNYARFLGRFQIASSGNTSDKTSTHEEMNAAREQLSKIDFIQLRKTLDPDGDNSVTVQEFVNMLPLFGVKVEMFEAATMYENFLRLMNVPVLSVDDMLICLACIGQDIPSDRPAIVTRVRELLREKGCNLARAFNLWDKTQDGFLQVQEIASGLQSLLEGAALADAKKVADLDAAAPQLKFVVYPGQCYDPSFLEQMQQMSQDMATQQLVQKRDQYEGYVLRDNLAGVPTFAKKGAKMMPQIGYSVVTIDTSSPAQAATTQVPSDTNTLIKEFVAYLQTCCVDVNKVNIIEWIRGSVPRSFLIKNQEIMMKDLLKRVWWAKQAFQALCRSRDPNATGKISRQDFLSCVQELNQIPEFQGHAAMSENHAQGICAAACGRSEVVNYRGFLDGLHAVDAAPRK